MLFSCEPVESSRGPSKEQAVSQLKTATENLKSAIEDEVKFRKAYVASVPVGAKSRNGHVAPAASHCGFGRNARRSLYKKVSAKPSVEQPPLFDDKTGSAQKGFKFFEAKKPNGTDSENPIPLKNNAVDWTTGSYYLINGPKGVHICVAKEPGESTTLYLGNNK